MEPELPPPQPEVNTARKSKDVVSRHAARIDTFFTAGNSLSCRAVDSCLSVEMIITLDMIYQLEFDAFLDRCC